MGKTIKTGWIAAAVIGLVLGCGLWANRPPVSKEQIDADIAKQTVAVDDGEWFFGADANRCFEVLEKEVKQTDSTAEIPVLIGSWWEMRMSDGKTVFPSLIGRMRIYYKKAGDKWEFEKIEPSMLIKRYLDEAGFKNFLALQLPLCKYHEFKGDRNGK